MRLTEIDKESLTDEEIEKIVYSDITDTGESTTYGIVFGNSMLIKERVKTAVDAYQQKRITKVIFTGGINGISSEFHLKRCMAIIKKKYPNIKKILIPSFDGFTDKNNWYLSDTSWNTGRSIVTYEANLLIKYAKEGKIENLNIKGLSKVLKK